jgi:uncharacterized protein with von Willebrand factor type A (vWA) domain
LLNLLGDFIGELRSAGIPVSMSEHVDAARAMEVIVLSDRELVRSSLATTLVKDGDHLTVFNTAFEVFFSTRSWENAEQFMGDDLAGELEREGASGATGPGQARGEGGGASSSLSAQELSELLFRALRDGDREALRLAANESVTRYAGMEPGRPVGGTYYLYRTLRSLELDQLEQRLHVSNVESEGHLVERLAREEAHARIELLKSEIERVIRERLVDDRGAEALAKSVRKPLPEDMHANRDEMAQLERALRPLSRKLATRLARRRRRRRRGSVDLRHTVRRSLSTGGVPIDLRFRPPHPAKPEIFVIADISGSVASFARFTLHLVHAISSQFSKVRSFVFVDGLDEVTSLFDGVDDPAQAVARINSEADVIAFDGHSDYGRALLTFHEKFAKDVTKRSTVLILGDARNNYHQAHAEIIADLHYRAKSVYWLNPEPTAYWNSGDSIINQYAPYCERVIECRTLRQLEAFVGELG